ncbi:hypothetical protein TUBRATIS_29220 [Tubulinosema ratisbonensis]|uniref:Uncharacterized protein n=1 Tax=Tubulinosema ratisbonensis TaxID=291195 RepID=A0A437AHQ4_9MICR|nr:hypothetical protein TUBRATIS_29220 [Tubulinosema ratisbonensis]
MFCVFITIGGYNLRNKSLINNTFTEEIFDNIEEKDVTQGYFNEKDIVLSNNDSLLVNKQKNPLFVDINLNNVLDTQTEEEGTFNKTDLSEEEKEFTEEELDFISNHISDEERKHVTTNYLFIGRVFHLTTKMYIPLQNFQEINQKLEKYDTKKSSEISKKMISLRNKYQDTIDIYLDILFTVKNNQIDLSSLYLEQKDLKFNLSNQMKSKIAKEYESFHKSYLSFTKNILSLYENSILINKKMFSIYKEILSINNLEEYKDEVEPLLFELVKKGGQSQNFMAIVLQNVNFKLNDGFELMKNYYELCKEKHEQNDLSDKLFKICEQNFNSISKHIENVNSEWEKTNLKINETLSEESLFLKGKGININ